MIEVARSGNYIFYTDFGTLAREGTVTSGEQGLGETLSIFVEQVSLQRLYLTVKIEPINNGASTDDFWDTFFSNIPGGEPSDGFGLGGSLSWTVADPSSIFYDPSASLIDSTSVQLNADSFDEGTERFRFALYESVIDQPLGVPPVAFFEFAVVDDDPQMSSRQFVKGTSSNDIVLGTPEADRISARKGDDVLVGLVGNDVLKGGSGSDHFIGGEGKDRLLGGRDKDTDTFVFESVTDSGKGKKRDVIKQFGSEDIIDLREIASNVILLADQEFSLSPTAASNSLWLKQLEKRVVINADIDGDARSDFQISVSGFTELTDAHFIW